MELTREEVKNWAIYATDEMVRHLAQQLLAEIDKPSVWTDAPEWATHATVEFTDNGKNPIYVQYTREPPKSRERQIADEVYRRLHTDVNLSSIDIPIIEQALLKYKAELEAGR